MRRAFLPSIAQREVRAFLLAICTLSAVACLVLGLTQPVIRLTHLYFWSDTHSILSILAALWTGGEYFLACVIFVFSIVVPALKLIYIATAGTLTAIDPALRRRWFKRIGRLGKWSMLDVLVLALFVFYARAAQFGDAITLPGVYFFAASVLLTMIAYSLIGVEHVAVEPEGLNG
jgi:paraquat-inducible protein A